MKMERGSSKRDMLQKQNRNGIVQLFPAVKESLEDYGGGAEK